MSNAGPGLSPNTQAATTKVKATNTHGDTVTQGYQAGTRTPPRGGDSSMFKTNQPKAPSLAAGTGGSKGTGGRGREPSNLVGPLYTKPRNY